MARIDSSVEQGHSHKYEANATKGTGAPRTSVADGHDHKVIRTKDGRAIRLGRGGEPPHVHSVSGA